MVTNNLDSVHLGLEEVLPILDSKDSQVQSLGIRIAALMFQNKLISNPDPILKFIVQNYSKDQTVQYGCLEALSFIAERALIDPGFLVTIIKHTFQSQSIPIIQSASRLFAKIKIDVNSELKALIYSSQEWKSLEFISSANCKSFVPDLIMVSFNTDRIISQKAIHILDDYFSSQPNSNRDDIDVLLIQIDGWMICNEDGAFGILNSLPLLARLLDNSPEYNDISVDSMCTLLSNMLVLFSNSDLISTNFPGTFTMIFDFMANFWYNHNATAIRSEFTHRTLSLIHFVCVRLSPKWSQVCVVNLEFATKFMQKFKELGIKRKLIDF